MLYISGFCYWIDFPPEVSWMNVSVGLLAMFLSLYYVVQLYCTVQFYMTSALASDLRERERQSEMWQGSTFSWVTWTWFEWWEAFLVKFLVSYFQSTLLLLCQMYCDRITLLIVSLNANPLILKRQELN